MTFADQAREHLADCIFPAIACAKVFASELGIAPVTLRNKLRAEGTTWSKLRNAEMIRRVDALRREGVSERDIAEDLGYETMQGYTRFLSDTRPDEPEWPPWEAPSFVSKRSSA